MKALIFGVRFRTGLVLGSLFNCWRPEPQFWYRSDRTRNWGILGSHGKLTPRVHPRRKSWSRVVLIPDLLTQEMAHELLTFAVFDREVPLDSLVHKPFNTRINSYPTVVERALLCNAAMCDGCWKTVVYLIVPWWLRIDIIIHLSIQLSICFSIYLSISLVTTFWLVNDANRSTRNILSEPVFQQTRAFLPQTKLNKSVLPFFSSSILISLYY